MLTAALFQACLEVFNDCLFSKSYAWLMKTYLPGYSFNWLITMGSTHCSLSACSLLVTLPATGLLPLLSRSTRTTWVWAQDFSVQASASCIQVSGPQLWTSLLVHAGVSLPGKTFDLPQIIPSIRDNRQTMWTSLVVLESHGTVPL